MALSRLQRAGGRRRGDAGEDVAGFYLVLVEPLVGHLVHGAVEQADAAVAYADSETEDTLLMEGVYIKVENDERVVGRMKAPRREFEKIRTDDHKWGRRPLFPNQLAPVRR